MVLKICVNCKKKFEVQKHRENKAKFCNMSCYWADKKGKKPVHLKGFTQGHTVNVGRKRPDLTYMNMHHNAMWNKYPKKQIEPGKILHNKYIWILTPKHPNANYGGYVKEHRLNMEKELGRFLTKTEVVHHIDRDKTNNTIDNLKLFKSHSEHMKEHNNY